MELKVLFRRASPFKERCSMVDAASKPARTLLRSSTRAHPEVGMLIVDASREMAVCTCQPAVVREEPRGECTFTELVLSSSFGDTHTVFAQSGVLRSRSFLSDPRGKPYGVRKRWRKSGHAAKSGHNIWPHSEPYVH